MKAVGSSIIIEYFESNMTEGGIYVAQSVDAHDNSIKAKVISVGSGVFNVKAGETVLIPKLMKTPIDISKGLWTTQENQVLAIIDE